MLLVLEDLSAWQPGAAPGVAARVLAGMHRRWEGQAHRRWPWLRAEGAAIDLVEKLFGQTWPQLAAREDLTPSVRALGTRFVGHVTAAEAAAARAGATTLAHGDASMLNMRTSSDGEIVLLDWEDVTPAPGASDLAWMLVSSVDPVLPDEAIAADGQSDRRAEVLPAACVQGLLSLSRTSAGTQEAARWVERMDSTRDRP